MGYRHPNPRFAKIHRSYSVEDLARLFKVRKNTVRNWFKQGLEPVDDPRSTLIRGQELQHFLAERRSRSKQTCGPGRIYCLPCRAPKVPARNIADCIKTGDTTGTLHGICPDCIRMIYRRVNPQKLNAVRGDLEITVTQAPSRIEDGCRAGAKLCPPAKTKRRNLADAKRRNGKRDSDNHVGLRAQIPIHATLKGSNCCQGQGIIARGCAPVLDLCRALVKAGHDPRRPLHSYRGDVLALKVRSIGEGARLTVREDRAGPRFIAWEPFPRRVKALASAKAKKAARVAATKANEPSVGPGATVRASAKSLPDAHSGTGQRPR